MENTEIKTQAGGSFLITEAAPEHTFTPEDFSDEQRMVADTCNEFLDKEVIPNLIDIDLQKEGLMVSLLDKAGELGLLGAAFPEKYGGLGEDFVTSTLINECLGGGHSFAVAMAAHNGIGSLPILYFGTEEQKQKYMPKLATGEYKGAYALTEPNSGSDALSGKTTATLTDDGQHYLLNGQKIWITNSGFAHIFTVFAKVNDQFSAFIVERGTEGMSFGEEEHKMGIKGSSTRQVYFENCKIPAANLLGEIGRGHIIAFNILNIGRLKLCAAALGGAKRALNISLKYATTREQFKTPIAQFGAIQHKLAEMAIRVYATDSALYRTAKWIADKEHELDAAGKTEAEAQLGAAEEYAIECAMLKVLGSEALDYVVDEGVQIHGGNGFSDEYAISRSYRDSRINRIFEGTNEINRLLVLDMYLKRAMKGRIDLMKPAMAIQKELMGIPDFSEDDTPYAAERKAIANFKKAILMCAGAAVQKLMMKIDKEQELLMYLADMLIDTFMAESMLLRTMKLEGDKQAIAYDATRVFIADAADRINHAGKNAINAFATGDEQRMMLLGIKRFTKVAAFNTKDARRNIAKQLIDKGEYLF